MRSRPLKIFWVAAALLSFVAAGAVQRYVERRRIESNLTWTEPAQKQALEVGFLALGGFRGMVADVLWVRAIGQQDAGRYYELKLLCDLIQQLQPTFAQVHAFQAHNMSFNLANSAESDEDKWYWIHSGIAALEKGLVRTRRNFSLWFELGWQYLHRLRDNGMKDAAALRNRELPKLADLSEDERLRVFSGEISAKRGSPDNEHLRYAGWCFWEAMKTGMDPLPIRTERIYGYCLQKLGLWRTSKPLAERKNWDDWGAEEWWLEVIRRGRERSYGWMQELEDHLRECMCEQMSFYTLQTERAQKAGNNTAAAENQRRAQDAYARYRGYVPGDTRSFEQLLESYRAELRKRPGAVQ